MPMMSSVLIQLESEEAKIDGSKYSDVRLFHALANLERSSW